MKKLSTRLHAMTRSPIFWGIQLLVFIACTLLSLHYYPKAFPIVDLEIKLTRKEALEQAKQLAEAHHFLIGPTRANKTTIPFRQTASFSLDQMTQTFVELSAGGPSAFKQLIREKLYFPYTWDVRNFAEGQTSESHVYFTPEGNFYGFYEKIPENQPGAALSFDAARKIAEESFHQYGALDLSPFKLVENSQERRPEGRVDHTLVYERESKILGEGRFRLRLVVSGDRLTEIVHFIKIPEAFARKYSEMRSFNNTISLVASVLMALFYLVGGCVVGLFFLGRIRWVIWKLPVICGVVVAAFQALEKINQLPLLWMSYDTAIGAYEFLLRFSANIVVMFILDALLLSVSFMAAESLSRRAFGKHPQLWRIWAPGNANSMTILGRTLGGYLSVGFFFSFVVFAYLFGTRYLHWWSPSDALFQPDSLASYFPWFTSIAHSLHAGFWEECLFRAVPLAGAALLGTRFGHRKKWIFAAFILQALIFAGAHANYPAQPSYARVVELIIPSFLFGGFYLVFGLVPGIILHFTFDVVSFAIPIFSAQVPGIWKDQLLVVLLTLTPLWISLFFRLKQGRWTELKPTELNHHWTPPTITRKEQKNEIESISHRQPPRTVIASLVAAAVLSVLLGTWVVHYKSDVPSLGTQRNEAVKIAQQELLRRGVDLTLGWEALSFVHTGQGIEDRFLWQTEGATQYRRIAPEFLTPPSWVIRFVRFDADVVERAEEYSVLVTDAGKILRVAHELPEDRAGESLSQSEAKQIAFEELQKNEGEGASHFKDVSNTSSKLPKRMDWNFIFSDSRQKLKQGDARLSIGIAGDHPVTYHKFIFVPEEWLRKERARENWVGIVKTMSILVLFSLVIGGMVVALMNWSKKKFDRRTFTISFFSLLMLEIVEFLNSLPARIAHFSTAEPKYIQLSNALYMNGLKILVISAGTALLLGYIHYRSKLSKPYRLSLSTLIGYATGLTGMGIVLGLSKVTAKDVPTWGRLEGFDSYLPILKPLGAMEGYIQLSLVFLLLALLINHWTRHWTQRRILGAFLLILFSGSFCGIQATTFLSWGLSTAALSAFLILAFHFILNSHLSLIPLATAGVFVLSNWKQMQLHPYKGSTLHDLMSALFILGLSWLWFKKLRKTPKS